MPVVLRYIGPPLVKFNLVLARVRKDHRCLSMVLKEHTCLPMVVEDNNEPRVSVHLVIS